MHLPEGLSRREFDRAVEKLGEVVGTEWVITSEEHLLAYRDPFSPYAAHPEEERAAACMAVAPKTTEEVQAVLRIANDYEIPFWVISTGKNFGYGGADPIVDGSMMLDLKRMDKIYEINEKLCYAVVEPGVSQYELFLQARKEGKKLWVDGPSPPWASVIANTLERGAGYGPLSERIDQICGMEVVLPDGEVLRTGCFAVPNSSASHTYKYGMGPWIDGMFSQSNMGVVTRMGVYLNPEPKAYRAGHINIGRYENLIETIDIVNMFRCNGVLNHGTSILLNPPPGFSRFTSDQAMDQRGAPPEPNIYKGVETPPPGWGWQVRFSLHGHEKGVAADWEVLRNTFTSEIPDVTFESDYYTQPYNFDEMDTVAKLQGGIPSAQETELWEHGVMFISMLLPASGEEYWRYIKEFQQIWKDLKQPRPFYGGIQHYHSRRSVMTLTGAPVNPNDRDFNERSMQFANAVFEAAAKHGWGEYRAPVPIMQVASDQYSWNNHALRRFNERVKDAIDPKGIMQPGKYGIWPEKYRG